MTLWQAFAGGVREGFAQTLRVYGMILHDLADRAEGREKRPWTQKAAAIGACAALGYDHIPESFWKTDDEDAPGPNDCTAQHPSGANCRLMRGHEARRYPRHYAPEVGTWNDDECRRAP